MSNFMGVGIFWIGLNRADLGCWRLTLSALMPICNSYPFSKLYILMNIFFSEVKREGVKFKVEKCAALNINADIFIKGTQWKVWFHG